MIHLRQYTNPLEWQERRYQQRHTPLMMHRWRWLGVAALLLAVGVIALTLHNITSPTRELGILTVWFFHALTGARAIAAGATAISREHVGQTWIPLVLTGVSVRRILLGKWLGVLHHVAPWMLALGTVRLIMIPVFMMAFVNRYAWRAMSRYSTYNGSFPVMMEWVPWAAIASVILTVVLTVLDVLCCTAIGMATSAIFKRSAPAMIAALCLRFAPVVLFGAFTRYEVGLGPSWRVLRFMPLAVADGGSAPLYQLSLPLTYWTPTAHVDALSGILLAGLLLFSMMSVALVVTWFAIRQAGALPEARVQRVGAAG